MIPSYVLSVMKKADEACADGATFDQAVSMLRRLGLDDFGLIFISMPHDQFPHLSRLLPAMASAEAQNNWTGSSGEGLLRQSAAFARAIDTACLRYGSKPLHESRILDFGVGYGRIVRLMYFYAPPERIWGVDAWQQSLDQCAKANLLGTFLKSDAVPDTLPVGKTRFDVAYAFSIFTHLAMHTAKAVFAAVRKNMNTGGLFVVTFRPVEIWQHIKSGRKLADVSMYEQQHRESGFAYMRHASESVADTYGDISVEPRLLEHPGWQLVALDRHLIDPFQRIAILKAV